MNKVQYVFWDSDNTLVNTAQHHWLKHVAVLKDYSITLDESYRQKIYENNGVQNWTWICSELGLTADQETYLGQIDQWYFDHITDIEIRHGIPQALKQCKAANIPQAVVSNGRRRSVMAALEGKDIAHYFDFILCKEDYNGRKPDPAPYLTAIKRMEEIHNVNIDPATCMAIEDDPLGVQAAKAAGMQVIHRAIGDDKEIQIDIPAHRR